MTLDRTLIMNSTAPLPANAGNTYVIDSTRMGSGGWVAAASATAPGTTREMLAGYRVQGSILPTGQAVTVYLELLTKPTGTTSGAFEADATADSAGVITVASNTTKIINWLPITADWRIRVLAGATAPTALDTSFVLSGDHSAGVY
jgi:hypothetical protein